MVITTITSKGQTTIPSFIRHHWRSKEVYWEQCPDGSATVRSMANVLDLFGSVKSAAPKDVGEKAKTRAALGSKMKREAAHLKS
jgi:bifunctional DNA-binding transcriptional regulator/antitoxin component of YhaV-PrlF toxin-antitoxin module